MVIISEKASEKIRNLSKRLRIKIISGGCSGFQYQFILDNEITDEDIIFCQNNVEIVVDQTSLIFLKNCILDYKEDLTGEQFIITNPNTSISCGCGNSFSV